MHMANIIVGFFSGIISGMGIGGGAILIPALILLQNVSQQVAQGINLLYFLPTAAVSLIIHIKNKNVVLKTALILGISGVLGAILGSIVAVKMPSDLLRRFFGIFLFLIGIYEVYKGIQLRRKNPSKK